MKASKLHTLWIMIRSAWITVYYCGYAVIRAIAGKLTRPWVDDYVRRWAVEMLRVVQINYKVSNPHNVQFDDHKAYIVMCNHSSLYDIPLAFVGVGGSLRMLAKKELARVPVMGSAMKVADFPFIDRHNRQQAMKDLQKMQELMESGIVVWFAPEGTRSKTGKLGPFKKGGFITAIQSGATIVPIGIRGANEVLPAKSFQFHLGQQAEINIGKPVDASQFKLTNKQALMDDVEKQIRELSGN